MWKSTNATSVPATNVTWTALTDQQASLVNGAVSVKPDGSVVLVGTGEPDNAIDSYYGVGILRSTNQGNSWTLIPSATGNNPALSFAGLGFASFAWDIALTSTVVAATGTTAQGLDDGEITSSTNRGLYYSGDSGQTWAFQVPQDGGVAISPASISATDVVFDAVAGKFFAAIRHHGLYSSTNGTNWTRMANQPAPLSAVNCPVASASTCPIYRGQLSVVKGRDEVYFWFISLDQSSNVIDEGIWQSINGGTWNLIDETGIANCGDPGNNGCGVEQGYYNLKIAAVPDGQATDLYAGAVNLFKCQLTTGATACTTLDQNFPNQWINLTHVYGCSGIAKVHPNEHGLDFMLANGQAVMYFGNDGGIYRTLDGFTKLDSGSCGAANGFDNLNSSSVPNGTIGSMTQFVSFSLHPTDQNTVLGGTQGNGSPGTSSATASQEWPTVNGGDGGYNAINAYTPDEWYTANTYVNIYACASGAGCTTDDFSLTVGSEEVGGDVGAFYTPYILDPQDPNEMIVGTCRVWRGAPTVPPSSFSTLSVDFDTLSPTACTGEEVNLVRSLDAGGTTADFMSTTVYATTDGTGPNAASPSGGEVWVTNNAGIAPMAQITSNINPSNYTISSVAVDRSDRTGATAYVGIMGFNVAHVFKTTNAGATWSDWSGSGSAGLPDAPVNALLIDSSVTPSQIYAGTDVGLFVSSTVSPPGNPPVWSEVGTPSLPGATGYLPNVPVTAIRMFNYNGTKKLRVSTYGRGIWEYALALAPDYTNVISNTPQTVSAAQNATFSGTLTAVAGYASPVNLSCTGAVPTTCNFGSTPVTPTASGATYTLTAGGVAGDYTFNAHAVGTDSQAITHDATVTLHIVAGPAPDFTPAVTATPNSTVVGQSVTWNGTLTALNGYNASVNLSCTGTAPGTCTFNPSSLVPTSAGAAFTVTVGNATAATFNFNIQGTDGTLTHTQAVSLTVGTDVTWTDTGNNAVTAGAGQNATYKFSAVPVGGVTFSGTVSFACSNLPVLTSCSFSPPSIAAGEGTTPVTLTISTTGPNQNSASSSQYPVPSDQRKPPRSQPSSGKAGGLALVWLLTFPVAGLLLAGIARRRPTRKEAIAASFVALAWLTSLLACGGALGGGATSPNPVSVSPSRANVVIGTQQQFTASQTVTWGVTGASNTLPIGTIDTNGIYSAPAEVPDPATVTVTATPTVSGFSPGSATVTVTNPVLAVTVSPNLTYLFVNEAGNTWPSSATQQQFSASVNNGASQTVTWAVTGGNGNGTIDANGLYTSPAVVPNPASVVVTATSTLTATPGSGRVNIQPATALGTYSNIQVTATAAGGMGHMDEVTLVVN